MSRSPDLDALSAALVSAGVTVTLPSAAPAPERVRLESAVFNGAVPLCPLAVVACPDEGAVRAALGVAAEYAVPVSVLAGGHDLAGRGLGPGNLVLDLRPMAGVRFEPGAGTVTLGGGALTGDLLDALPEDRVAVTGTVLSVGVAGLTLAGGYGRLNSRFGLAADDLVRARVVLADGSVVTASAEEDSDLLWALRGGGSGFGAVTSLTLATHALKRVLTAMVLYPLDRARDALLRGQDLIDRHPVDLSLFMGFMTAPSGDPMLFLAPMWSGEPEAGEALVEDLTGRPGAHVLNRGWSSYRGTFDEESEKAWPKGRHYHIPTQTLRRLDARAAEILVAGAGGMTSPNSAIVLHDFHGVAARVAPEATAFPLREDHVVVEVIAAWDAAPEAQAARHRAWADGLSAALAEIAVPGGYTNLLTPDEAGRVRLFYGTAADRLRAVKRRVDPGDLFRSGIGRLVA